MSKFKLPLFAPEIRLASRGPDTNELLVIFDSAMSEDLKRSPRLVVIGVEHLSAMSITVEPKETVNRVTHCTFEGSIFLVTSDAAEGAQKKYLLAEYAIQLDGQGRPDKNGTLLFPPDAAINQLIRHGLADAFSDAQHELLDTELQIAMAINSPASGAGYALMADSPVVTHQPDRKSSTARAEDSSKSKPWGMKMWTIMALIGLLMVAAVVKIASSSNDPVQKAVDRALANDPASVNQQIEITRRTLQEMGLDPDKGGDLGCLTPAP